MPANNRKPKYRLATDDEITVGEDKLEEAIKFLKSRLRPEEMSHIQKLLSGEQADDEKEEKQDDKKDADMEAKAKDGLPRPGGKMVASDSRGNTFADRFPDSARIRVV